MEFDSIARKTLIIGFSLWLTCVGPTAGFADSLDSGDGANYFATDFGGRIGPEFNVRPTSGTVWIAKSQIESDWRAAPSESHEDAHTSAMDPRMGTLGLVLFMGGLVMVRGRRPTRGGKVTTLS